MSQVIILNRFNPSPVGHGGNHRSYQIWWDCVEAFGASNVTAVPFSSWRQHVDRSMERYVILKWRLMRCLRRFWRNPGKLFDREGLFPDQIVGEGFFPGQFTISELLKQYEKLVRQVRQPVVCVIEHGGFSDFISVNKKYEIPTVICPQNIESFDVRLFGVGRFYNLVRLVDFSDEFAILAQCAERLFISKVEAGLIGGLGLTARYYPYRPVGEIERGLQTIRERREKSHIVSDLFLIVGSAGHRSTWDSIRWFIDNALQHGLPEGVKIAVVGMQTDELDVKTRSSAEIFEFRGWVEQEELDDLLSRARAVLIPQTCGFGALTRLSEFVLAGLPVIVSRHPTLAIDLMPGVLVVDDDWDAWYEAIHNLSQHAGKNLVELDGIEYNKEDNTLISVLRQLLSG